MTWILDRRIAVCISLVAVTLVLSYAPAAALPPTPTMAPKATPTTALKAALASTPTAIPSASATLAPSVAPATSSDLQTVWLHSPAGMRGDGIPVDWQLSKTMGDAGITKPPLAAKDLNPVEMILTDDPFTAVNDLFYKRGWTDGLPIVPPTDVKLVEMYTGTNRAPADVVAAVDPIGGQATIEKIAVNAVMAGCRPEYMPVLIAAVEAIADPKFDLTAVGTTTNPDATMLIINGPIAKQLDINSGSNALGSGWEANARIGRALHLIEQNVGGSWPGVSRVASLGQPGSYSMMLAENEAENPWQPLHVELGFAKDKNVVTVVSAEGMQRVLDIGVTPEGFLARAADYVSALDVTNRDLLLILTPTTAQKLAEAGWNKESIRKYINDHARIPLFRYKTKFTGQYPTGIVPDSVLATQDANGMVQVPLIDQLVIIVAGGVGQKDELMPLWTRPVSREIQLPPNWNALLANAAK